MISSYRLIVYHTSIIKNNSHHESGSKSPQSSFEALLAFQAGCAGFEGVSMVPIIEELPIMLGLIAGGIEETPNIGLGAGATGVILGNEML